MTKKTCENRKQNRTCQENPVYLFIYIVYLMCQAFNLLVAGRNRRLYLYQFNIIPMVGEGINFCK
jgi:hypothetical protein